MNERMFSMNPNHMSVLQPQEDAGQLFLQNIDINLKKSLLRSLERMLEKDALLEK